METISMGELLAARVVKPTMSLK